VHVMRDMRVVRVVHVMRDMRVVRVMHVMLGLRVVGVLVHRSSRMRDTPHQYRERNELQQPAVRLVGVSANRHGCIGGTSHPDLSFAPVVRVDQLGANQFAQSSLAVSVESNQLRDQETFERVIATVSRI
jgi:hypothetical protein